MHQLSESLPFNVCGGILTSYASLERERNLLYSDIWCVEVCLQMASLVLGKDDWHLLLQCMGLASDGIELLMDL